MAYTIQINLVESSNNNTFSKNAIINFNLVKSNNNSTIYFSLLQFLFYIFSVSFSKIGLYFKYRKHSRNVIKLNEIKI